jgi:hypothetical protein
MYQEYFVTYLGTLLRAKLTCQSKISVMEFYIFRETVLRSKQTCQSKIIVISLESPRAKIMR